MKKKYGSVRGSAKNFLWWFIQIMFIAVSIFFTILGVQLLLASYELNNPFTFVLTFFASNLIILISLALMGSFIWKMYLVYKTLKKGK